MMISSFRPSNTHNKAVQSSFGHIGHSHDGAACEEKPLLKPESKKTEGKKTEGKNQNSPWKLWLWGAADVTMMAGSVFMADMIVPEHHHHDHDHDHPTVQTPLNPEEKEQHEKEEKAAWWRHALQLSGIATGLHMLSHVGLAGGWYLYGRSRGKGKHEEELKDFEKVQRQLKVLEKEGANFTLVQTAPGEFVLKARTVQAPSAKAPQTSLIEIAKTTPPSAGPLPEQETAELK